MTITRLYFNDIAAAVMIDGRELVCHDIIVEAGGMTCWITPEAFKNFSVSVWKIKRKYPIDVSVRLDGSEEVNVGLFPKHSTRKVKVHSIPNPDKTERPLVFASLIVTDDEKIKLSDSAHELGEIKIKVQQLTDNSKSPPKDSTRQHNYQDPEVSEEGKHSETITELSNQPIIRVEKLNSNPGGWKFDTLNTKLQKVKGDGTSFSITFKYKPIELLPVPYVRGIGSPELVEPIPCVSLVLAAQESPNTIPSLWQTEPQIQYEEENSVVSTTSEARSLEAFVTAKSEIPLLKCEKDDGDKKPKFEESELSLNVNTTDDDDKKPKLEELKPSLNTDAIDDDDSDTDEINSLIGQLSALTDIAKKLQKLQEKRRKKREASHTRPQKRTKRE